MRNIITAALLGLGLTGLAATAHAGSATGTVTTIDIEGTRFAFLRLSTSPSSRPACHPNLQQSAFAIDLDTSKGRAILSVATSAMLAGKTVEIIGNNACIDTGSTGLGNIESIDRFTIR